MKYIEKHIYMFLINYNDIHVVYFYFVSTYMFFADLSEIHPQIFFVFYFLLKCTCWPGFRLKNDGRTCIDVDECSENFPCGHQCINTYGSFHCLCADGYQRPISNPHSCRSLSGTLLYSAAQVWMSSCGPSQRFYCHTCLETPCMGKNTHTESCCDLYLEESNRRLKTISSSAGDELWLAKRRSR